MHSPEKVRCGVLSVFVIFFLAFVLLGAGALNACCLESRRQPVNFLWDGVAEVHMGNQAWAGRDHDVMPVKGR